MQARVKNKTKYVLIKHPEKEGRLISEHRYKVQQVIGRELILPEVVHHIDKDKGNNDLSNLIAFTGYSPHARIHHGSEVFDDEILFDGRTYKG